MANTQTWTDMIGPEKKKPYFLELQEFVARERAQHRVFPPPSDVYNAIKLTPYDQVKVVILGQDPYHDEGQAHGLSFSVRPGVRPPPSLQNIFKEQQSDIGIRIPNNGYLVPWAEQGVLLLNAVLTVRAHQPASHKNKGWEIFTDEILKAVNLKSERVVYLLWGSFARQKKSFLTNPEHVIFEAPHPSPFSADKGFFGCRHFSKTNKALEQAKLKTIDWQLPDV